MFIRKLKIINWQYPYKPPYLNPRTLTFRRLSLHFKFITYVCNKYVIAVYFYKTYFL